MEIKCTIPIERSPSDYEFGSSPIKRKVLVYDGQWHNYLPDIELQRNNIFDSYGCVSYSFLNAIEILHRRVYGYELNFDDRDLVVGSGTKPRVGNSFTGVANFARNSGLLLEKGQIPPTMNEIEYYSWQRSQADKDEAEMFLKLKKLNYEWLPTCNFGQTYSSPDQLMEALLYSPIQLCVSGRYIFKDGLVCMPDNTITWNHAVVLIGYKKGVWWEIYDSETNKILRFEWNYKFGYPMVHYLTKLNMKLYKKKGEPAIYFLNPEDNKLVAYADGVIAGGSMFKILFGDYKYAPIETVDELPYPIALYQMKTV